MATCVTEWMHLCVHPAHDRRLRAVGAAGAHFELRIGWVNDTRLAVSGTPDEAVAQIPQLAEQSVGFGCYVVIADERPGPEATRRGCEVSPACHSSVPELGGTAAGAETLVGVSQGGCGGAAGAGAYGMN